LEQVSTQLELELEGQQSLYYKYCKLSELAVLVLEPEEELEAGLVQSQFDKCCKLSELVEQGLLHM
jgi:hypothetical protein